MPEEERFEIVTINPGLVMGPTLIPGNFSSGQILKTLLNGEMPIVPKVKFPIVSIHAVAQAHFNACVKPEAANQRFMLVNRCMWFKEIADSLEEFKQWGYKPPKRELSSYVAAWCLSKISNDIKLMLPIWGVEIGCENKKSIEILGIEYTDEKELLVAMGHSLIDQGIVPNKRPEPKKELAEGEIANPYQ